MGAAASMGGAADASDVADLGAGVTAVVAARKAATDSGNEKAIAFLNEGPADAADITTLDEAKAELVRLRKAAATLATEAPALVAGVTIDAGGQAFPVVAENDFMAIKDGDGNEGGLYKAGKQLSGFPAPLLTQLAMTTLNLCGNQIGALPEGISALVFLTELNVAECGLSTLPDGIGALCRLESLDCNDNKLKALPATIGGCVSLNTLIAFKNVITKLPDDIGLCSQLKELNFFNNKIGSLPATMSNLTQLEDVNFGSNAKLKYLPPTDKWTKITRLAIQWCGLNNTFWTMKSTMSFKTLEQLEMLQMDRNTGLTCLPDMGNMGKMTELIIPSMKALATLPEEIGTATSLTRLDASSCALGALPEGLGNCVAMEIINVGSNKLTALPASMGGMTALKTLMCFGNAGITTLPGSFINMKAVDRANFKGCNLNMGDADTAAVVAQFKKQCGAKYMG